MTNKPRHLMISGLDDCDPHRMSAEARGEDYCHVSEVEKAEQTQELSKFDIIYVDSWAYRENSQGEWKRADVRSERLQWIESAATRSVGQLFVVVNDGGWEPMLGRWSGRKKSNVFIQNPDSQHESGPDYLAEVVDAWRSIGNT